MNGDNLIAILTSIVFVYPFTIFAEENDGKRDIDFALTCATPVRSKADQEYPVRACSIELVPAGSVYIGVVEELLAANTASASLNHVDHLAESIQPELTLGLNAKSEFGIHSLSLSNLPSTLKRKRLPQSGATSSDSIDKEPDNAHVLQPLDPEKEIPLVEPEKHDFDSSSLEDENGLIHPNKIAAEDELLTPTLIDPSGVDDSTEPKSSQQLDSSTEVRMNFSDFDIANDKSQNDTATDQQESQFVEPLPATDEVKAESLIVHPPMIQPYNRNQHTFVIENRGMNPARDVTIEINVPESVRIVAALPINSVFSPHTAVFRFDEISSGDNVQVHLTAVNKLQESISFVANVSAKSTYEFGAVAANDPQADLDEVSYNLSSGENVSVTTDARSAAVIKNPYVGNRSNGEPATRR